MYGTFFDELCLIMTGFDRGPHTNLKKKWWGNPSLPLPAPVKIIPRTTGVGANRVVATTLQIRAKWGFNFFRVPDPFDYAQGRLFDSAALRSG